MEGIVLKMKKEKIEMEENQTKETFPKLKKEAENTDKKETLVYIGASLKNIVQSNTTFINGIPEALKEKIKEYPFLKKLLIPLEKMPEANQKLREKESALSMLYKKSKELK